MIAIRHMLATAAVMSDIRPMADPNCTACGGTGYVSFRPAEYQHRDDCIEQSCSCRYLRPSGSPLPDNRDSFVQTLRDWGRGHTCLHCGAAALDRRDDACCRACDQTLTMQAAGVDPMGENA